MEVGAVKQAFNNEVILLKKKLNQARIQTIHKLTRRAKSFVDKKVSEKMMDKFKRKAESAVNEVLIIKKLKPKDLAKFIVTHKGELNDFLNQPQVNYDKACARVLLHKVMDDKYRYIRRTFSNVSIDDLFMSRDERRKAKKEAKEKQKNKKKGIDKVNAENWDVEDINVDKNSEHDSGKSDNDGSDHENNNDSDEESNEKEVVENSGDDQNENSEENDPTDNESNSGKFAKLTPVKEVEKIIEEKVIPLDIIKSNNNVKSNNIQKKKSKPKDSNKNKNFNEKILLRTFKKTDNESPVTENKVVDPFFITCSGEKYMSVAEPRQPDEFKEIHRQGNRKLRRAAMFGHVPNIKPRRDFQSDQFDRNANKRKRTDNDGPDRNVANDKHKRKFVDNDTKNNFNTKNNLIHKNSDVAEKPEKLHPSWEAKKRQSGLLPFQGKKIVFDGN